MQPTLRLHYAPDNASLCVRIALEHLGLPYQTTLVNRSLAAQKDPAYLAMNPNGLIPVLETPDGPLFETAAILLWLGDQHPGTMMPACDDPARGPALTWLFWLANTLHPALRMLFYPAQYLPEAPDDLRRTTRQRLRAILSVLETSNAAFLDDPKLTLHGCYLGPMLRWAAIYGGDSTWFSLPDTPRLADFAARLEGQPAVLKCSELEGLGPLCLTNPRPARPTEGSPI